MDYAVKIAKELKKRNNKKSSGAVVGIVISSDPLRISIYGSKAILDSSNSLICSKLPAVIKGEKVLCLPTADGQTFFIIDKVVS